MSDIGNSSNRGENNKHLKPPARFNIYHGRICKKNPLALDKHKKKTLPGSKRMPSPSQMVATHQVEKHEQRPNTRSTQHHARAWNMLKKTRGLEVLNGRKTDVW